MTIWSKGIDDKYRNAHPVGVNCYFNRYRNVTIFHVSINGVYRAEA